MSGNKPNYENCFKSSFGIAISEIEGANEATVESLFNAINNNPGDFRKQAKALVGILGSSGWKWGPYEGELNKESDYKKMAQSMASSIEMLAHSLYRREQLFEVAERRPHWLFQAGADEHTPQECLEKDGVIKHFQDPFWEHSLPPCESPFCRCRVFALSERDLARRANKA